MCHDACCDAQSSVQSSHTLLGSLGAPLAPAVAGRLQVGAHSTDRRGIRTKQRMCGNGTVGSSHVRRQSWHTSTSP